jgi:hypothetical protein
MRTISTILLTGLCALFVLSTVMAQPPNAQNRVDRWNDMWMNFSNSGFIGNSGPGQMDAMQDPCPPNGWAPQCELPGGSGQQYLFQAGLWIGAIIDDNGTLTPRVSTGTDGWLNPAIMEFWPGPGAQNGIVERTSRDTTNCFGSDIYSPAALADHELSLSYTDTLTAPQYVVNDPIDGAHRPIGIKVTQTSYDQRSSSCDHIYWIHYVVENIGQNLLRDIYLGEYVDGDVGPMDLLNQHTDDLTGFEPTEQIAYICDNDGRSAMVHQGNDLIVPNVTGMMFLRDPEGDQRVSFNWWISNGDVALDYGPAWAAYANRDSLGMGWASDYGTPMGDLHKYQVMSNGEIDFDQIHVADANWIVNHPQGNHDWAYANYPPTI